MTTTQTLRAIAAERDCDLCGHTVLGHVSDGTCQHEPGDRWVDSGNGDRLVAGAPCQCLGDEITRGIIEALNPRLRETCAHCGRPFAQRGVRRVDGMVDQSGNGVSLCDFCAGRLTGIYKAVAA